MGESPIFLFWKGKVPKKEPRASDPGGRLGSDGYTEGKEYGKKNRETKKEYIERGAHHKRGEWQLRKINNRRSSGDLAG